MFYCLKFEKVFIKYKILIEIVINKSKSLYFSDCTQNLIFGNQTTVY